MKLKKFTWVRIIKPRIGNDLAIDADHLRIYLTRQARENLGFLDKHDIQFEIFELPESEVEFPSKKTKGKNI